jgi:receptor protein-tyrosine kinase
MAKGPDHLAERLAARLGGVGGLGAAAEGGEARRAAAPAAGDMLPQPPPVVADVAPEADGPAEPVDAVRGDGDEADLPPPPVVAEATARQEAAAGTMVLERPRREGGRDEIAPALGVNLDTMVPAPLTLDLVSLERAGMVVGRKARTRISEEFRVSVGQVLRAVRGSYTPGRGAGNLVMVTSARPGEGKSFSSLNLAGSIAQHTQREVLLVDVDAKQNALSDQLGVGDRPGLIDLALTPSLRIEDTVVRTVIPNLAFMPVGVRRVDSLEGGAEGTVARPITALIERLGRRFANHIVILDAPPCLSTSDPSTMAPLVGQIVMVVEAERTQRSEVLAALDLIKACPTITLMLNKIRVTTSYTFGAYHYFGSYS